jgi:hypothetical protein
MSHDYWLRPDSEDPNSPAAFFGIDRTAPTRLDASFIIKTTRRERFFSALRRLWFWLRGWS